MMGVSVKLVRKNRVGVRPQSSNQSYLSNFSVAIVEPEFAQNVGYLGRTMANFGLGDLLIVSANERKFGSRINKDEASKFASHGDYIIEEIKWISGMDALRARYKILVGTTAIRGKRKSNITRKTLELEKAVPTIMKVLASMNPLRSSRSSIVTQKTLCFVFGRDTTGLTNEELRKCDYNVSIVTGTKYNTLNISHAAAIIFYSFQTYLKEHQDRASLSEREGRIENYDMPSRMEKERVVSLFEDLAEYSDFQDFKKLRLKETVTRLLDRSNPSLRELYLLMGLASKARTKIRMLST
jgi:tRNA/rRNA methyltransferase